MGDIPPRVLVLGGFSIPASSERGVAHLSIPLPSHSSTHPHAPTRLPIDTIPEKKRPLLPPLLLITFPLHATPASALFHPSTISAPAAWKDHDIAFYFLIL